MTFQSYAVTRGCNPQTQQRRGELRGYAVTRTPYTCACVRVQAGACACAHACVCASGCNHVTVQLARRAAGFTVTRARNRVTHPSLSQKKKGNRMGHPLDQQPSAPATPDSGPAAGVSARRQAMPEVAAFVDLCRAAYGGQFVDVDAAMATAQQARREHAQVLGEQGEAAAVRWLHRNAHRCTFHAEEGGRSVGLSSPWAGTSTDTTATAVSVPVPPSEHAHPPIGTPPAEGLGGNSAPARAPVAGFGKSPVLGPVSGALSGSVAPARAGGDARAVAGSGFGGAV